MGAKKVISKKSKQKQKPENGPNGKRRGGAYGARSNFMVQFMRNSGLNNEQELSPENKKSATESAQNGIQTSLISQVATPKPKAKAEQPAVQPKPKPKVQAKPVVKTPKVQPKPKPLPKPKPKPLRKVAQTKLKIGEPGDKYEQEADDMAEKVVSRKGPEFAPATPPDNNEGNNGAQNQPLMVQRKCSSCGTEEQVQMKAAEEAPPIQQKCSACAAEEAAESSIQLQAADTVDIPKAEDRSAELSKMDDRMLNAEFQFPEVPDAEKEEAPTPGQDAAGEGTEGGVEGEAEAGAEGGAEGAEQMDIPKAPPVKIPEPELPEIQGEHEPSAESESPEVQKMDQPGGEASESLSSDLKSTKGQGQPLDDGTKTEMEGAFGKDFSSVRVHTNSKSTQLNQQLNSKAFTNESDIYFNEGEYNTGTTDGKRLLAHELTHTVQQGAVGESVQMFPIAEQKAQTEGKADKPNDGGQVEGRMDSKIKNDPDFDDDAPTSKSEMDEEAREKANPDRGEVRSEKSDVEAEGGNTPDVDRGAVAQDKTAEQKEKISENVSEDGGGEAAEGDMGEGEKENLSEADQMEASAKEKQAMAANWPVPPQPEPFKQPEIKAPVDSKGKALPRNGQIDTQVRGLGMIGELLRAHGYEMKKQAAEKEKVALGLDAALDVQRKDLANSREGTAKMQDHKDGRDEILDKSKTAHDESVQRQEFVAKEAPLLKAKAEESGEESGDLKSEADSKAEDAQSNVPDDPDARADGEKQAGDMKDSADGAKSMDDANTETAARSQQYIEDAAKAADTNTQSDGKIKEAEDTLKQTQTRLDEMKAKNEESQGKIDGAAGHPDTFREHAKQTAQSGDQLIKATYVMEADLISIQEEYISGMAAIEGKEEAEKRIAEEQKKKEKDQPKDISPEEKKVFELNAMDDKQQDEAVQKMDEKEKTGVMAALSKMIQDAPDKGTDASEGKRMEVKTGLNEMIMGKQPTDPRQEQITTVENKRIERVKGVKEIADANFAFLSQQEKAMLAQKLTGQALIDDVKNIDILQMGKGMIQGMIDPRMGLTGVVDGFEKFASGIANIFNAEAWAKDPLGNLLKIAADISTGLAMVFSSILGIAGMIFALMVAITIASWGFALPVTGPVMSWMGTIMTYAGWGAIIAGSLSVYFNYLSYIKNLHDAATAESSDELFGNVEEMKQNVTDGFQGAMAIVEGVGAVKMGPVLKSKDFLPDPNFKVSTGKKWVKGMKADAIDNIKNLPGNIKKGAKNLLGKGKKGLSDFKAKLEGLFSRKKKKGDVDVDVESPSNVKKQKDSIEGSANKKGSELSKAEIDAELDAAARGKAKPARRADEDVDIDIESGHTYSRKKKKGDADADVDADAGGKKKEKSKWCRRSDEDCGCADKGSKDKKKKLDDKADEVVDAEKKKKEGDSADPSAGEGSPDKKKKKKEEDTDTTQTPETVAKPEDRWKKGLKDGEVRTPEELKKARRYFERNKKKARKAWEERTGQEWPNDEFGNPVRASHDRPLADGGDPMVVEPKLTRDPNTEHMIKGKDGLTDQQRWGKREGKNKRGGARTKETNPRVIDELPEGQMRTPEELKKARQYFKNRKQKAREAWEKKTGKKWPIDPETNRPVRASHIRPLKDGGHPLEVEPGGNWDPNFEHRVKDKKTGLTDQQRWAKEEAKRRKQAKKNAEGGDSDAPTTKKDKKNDTDTDADNNSGTKKDKDGDADADAEIVKPKEDGSVADQKSKDGKHDFKINDKGDCDICSFPCHTAMVRARLELGPRLEAAFGPANGRRLQQILVDRLEEISNIGRPNYTRAQLNRHFELLDDYLNLERAIMDITDPKFHLMIQKFSGPREMLENLMDNFQNASRAGNIDTFSSRINDMRLKMNDNLEYMDIPAGKVTSETGVPHRPVSAVETNLQPGSKQYRKAYQQLREKIRKYLGGKKYKDFTVEVDGQRFQIRLFEESIPDKDIIHWFQRHSMDHFSDAKSLDSIVGSVGSSKKPNAWPEQVTEGFEMQSFFDPELDFGDVMNRWEQTLNANREQLARIVRSGQNGQVTHTIGGVEYTLGINNNQGVWRFGQFYPNPAP